MSERHQPAPQAICSIGDHLDTVLASLEDLLDAADRIEPAELLRLELTVITHLLQVREHVQDLADDHPDMIGPFAMLLEGTALLELPSAPKHSAASQSITPDYLIGQRISIGMVADLASRTFDALEQHYVLYDNDIETQPAEPTTGFKSPWWRHVAASFTRGRFARP